MLRKKAIRLFAVISGIISFCYLSIAQSYVSVHDTLIPRGKIYSIPISGRIDEPNVSNFRIKLQFNARVIDIKSATGADNYIMKCQKPKLLNPNFSDLEKSTIDIYCDSISATTAGIFCTIEVEGLVGPDSLTDLIPAEVFLNGNPDLLAVTEGGHIKVPGPPVYQRNPEGLGQNFPNPFSDFTIFPISIEKPTKVSFKIFTNNGTEVFLNGTDDKSFQLYKGKAKDGIKIDRFDSVLEKGSYELSFIPGDELASGSYFLVMQTDNGIYNRRFLYLK